MTRLPSRFTKGWRRFSREESGVTAIEFALVATPFFALIIAIFEIGLLFFAQEVLQTATTQASRLIMTGQAQAQNLSAAQFKSDVCNLAAPLLTCTNLYVNVKTFGSFGGITQSSPLSGGAVNTGSLNYSLGSPGDIVLVQVFYQWPVLLGPLGFNLSNMSGNNHLLVATAVFRNEP